MDIIKTADIETYFILLDTDRGVYVNAHLPFVPRVGDTISLGKDHFKVKAVVIHCGRDGDDVGLNGIEVHVQKMESPEFSYDNVDSVHPIEFSPESR